MYPIPIILTQLKEIPHGGLTMRQSLGACGRLLLPVSGRALNSTNFTSEMAVSTRFQSPLKIGCYYKHPRLWLPVRLRTSLANPNLKNEPNPKTPFLPKPSLKIFQFPLFFTFYYFGVLRDSMANQNQKTGKRTQFINHVSVTN